MSVHKETRNGNVRWRVKWREADRQKSRTFRTKDAAVEFDERIRLIARQGELAHELTKRQQTVQEMVAVWIDTQGDAVTQSTADSYARHFRDRILPTLGAKRVTALTPATIDRWISGMRKAGDQDPTIIKACTALQTVLQIAVKDGIIATNPVAQASKPAQRRTRQPYLILPDRVERMRAHMLAAGRERDMVLLELLAYAGLRPESEAITLMWRHVRARSILVVDTKRGKERSVPMVGHLAESLAAWRIRSGGRDRQLVIPPRPGKTWATRDEWRYWRRHVFAPAAAAAGLPADVRPRDLRGSFVSLLINEGRSVVEVARICGHAPEVCLRDYAQVVDEYDPAYRRSADEVIAEARAKASSDPVSDLMFPQRSAKESA